MPTAINPSSQSSEMTGNTNPMEYSIFADTQPGAEQSETVPTKSARPTAKKRKSELEDYRTAFFAPIKLGKDNKHQVAISNDTFDRVERAARFFGGPGYSVSNFVEHIINEHLDNNAANYEGWFALISKSF